MFFRTLWECITVRRVAPDSEELLRSADVIATHGFGTNDEIGTSNLAIVEMAVDLARRLNKPLMCQYPGSLVAEQKGVEPVLVVKDNMRHPGVYVDSDEVNFQFAYYCQTRGWKKVILLAHPDHLWRAKRNLMTYGRTVYVPDVSTVPYDQEAKWKQLRWPWFYLWDFLARMKYLTEGKI